MSSRSGTVRRTPASAPGLARVNAAGDETREQLMLVAERLFAEFGIDGVSIRHIAAKAGQRNPAAVSFWRRVVALYTGGRYQERVVNGEVRQVFESGYGRRATGDRPG